MSAPTNNPMEHKPSQLEKQNHGHQQQQRPHHTLTLSQHYENVSRIDTVIHALASGQKTLGEMGAMLNISIAVLHKQIAWFGIQGFHCLRYYGHCPKESFNSIAIEFEAMHRTWKPLFSQKMARKVVVDTFKIMAELAGGRAMGEIVRRRPWSKIKEFNAASMDRYMALYCMSVVAVMQKLGIRRSILHKIMTNAQAGMPLKQAFLELGIAEALHSIRKALLEGTQPYPGPPSSSILGPAAYGTV